MPSIKRGLNYLLHNRAQFCDSIINNFCRWLPDKPYLSLRYRCLMGHWIDWKNPKAFTEKLQWLKVYNRKPEYTTMVDKYAVKQYVAERIGEEYIISTLGVWNRPEDIDWDALPEQFVLKTTHAGGGSGVVICSDKKKFDKQVAIKKLKASLDSSNYSYFREWPYKNVQKRIIAEMFIAPVKDNDVNIILDSSDKVTKSSISNLSETTEDAQPQYDELKDYKFFCFNGKVKFFKIDFNRFIEHHANYYSPQGELLEFGEMGLEPKPDADLLIPANIQDMIALAEQLANTIPFVRVDLYNVNGKIYFGELTFYPASGLLPWSPSHYDYDLGNLLNLNLR